MATLGRTVALAMLREHRDRGERIARLRDAHKWTQREAAQLAGVTEKTWSSWEAGSGMKPSNVRKAAEVLGTTIDEIEGRDSETPDPFSLARHLDENVELFREYSYAMQDALERVEATVDGLARALVAEGTIRQASWTKGVEEAAAILRAAREDDEPRARGTGTDGRG